MKLLAVLLVALFSVFITSCDQQKAKIPEKVQTSFNELFPTASDVEWEMEDENEWEAEFEMDGKEITACFNIDGIWIETEYAVEMLPETIETILLETYPGFEIEEVEMVESTEFSGYEIMLKNGEEELEVKVTLEGEIILDEMDMDDDMDMDEMEEDDEGIEEDEDED